MDIKRDFYLQKLISYMWDGQIKVITGIRRCGKSYLLNNLFKSYLVSQGVPPENILTIALDLVKDIQYRNPLFLAASIRQRVEKQAEQFYLFIDEIQMSDMVPNPYNEQGKKISFYDALNDLKSLPNLDIYVTGSNSKMLSRDILTEFRGRSDEIRVHPLSFAEYYSALGGDKHDALENYAYFGGMPLCLSRPNEAAKRQYLSSLVSEVYLRDIVERNKIERQDVLGKILDLLCSSIGSLTNPTKITNTLNSEQKINISQNTVRAYMDYLSDAYLISEAKRYDVRGKAYFKYPNKYYCEDLGLRNARIGFRQQEMTHMMENIVYNELISRDFSVDVGVVFAKESNANGNSVRVPREIDFVANNGSRQVYIQSAYAMDTDAKRQSELRPFSITGDAFPKIIVRYDTNKRWYDEHGVLNIGLIEFLLDKEALC